MLQSAAQGQLPAPAQQRTDDAESNSTPGASGGRPRVKPSIVKPDPKRTPWKKWADKVGSGRGRSVTRDDDRSKSDKGADAEDENNMGDAAGAHDDGKGVGGLGDHEGRADGASG